MATAKTALTECQRAHLAKVRAEETKRLRDLYRSAGVRIDTLQAARLLGYTDPKGRVL